MNEKTTFSSGPGRDQPKTAEPDRDLFLQNIKKGLL